MTRSEVVALIVAKARQHGIEPWEFLAGAIAESALNPDAARFGTWPDVSFGLFQQTVKYADEGDHSASPENIALIRRLYSDPAHACDVAAKKYLYWRHDPDVPPLTAWVAYNGPSYYRTPEQSPNIENYRSALQEALAMLGTERMTVRYDPNAPALAQDDDWSCAPTALRWALTSLGRNPGPTYIEDLLLRDGVVTKEAGLLDASGAYLAAWIGKTGPEYYGADGFYGNSEPVVTYNGAALEGDHQYPILIGGRAWNHWTAVRGYDRERNVLLLANPAPGFQGVGQTMSPEQFAQLGPFSMVRVLHPDLPGVGPAVVEPDPPIIVVPPTDTRMARARELLVAAMAVLDEPAPA